MTHWVHFFKKNYQFKNFIKIVFDIHYKYYNSFSKFIHIKLFMKSKVPPGFILQTFFKTNRQFFSSYVQAPQF